MTEDRRHHFHGRRVSRPLRSRPQALMENLLPRLRVTADDPGLPRPPSLFSPEREEVWLEIGFGGGEHLASRAEANPQAGIIGAEPFVNGVAKLLALVEERRLANVRICDDDVRYLLEKLARQSISRIFVLYPDPWPKLRHRKRRIISDSLLKELARVARPGAEFLFASDIPDYCGWTLEHVRRNGSFEWLAEKPSDWRDPPQGWPGTRYEAKALREGRTPCYLTFRRKP